MTDQLLAIGDDDEPRLMLPKPVPREKSRPKYISAKGQSESSQLEDLADRLFKKLLMKLANGKCETSDLVAYYEDGSPLKCGGALEVSHGVKRWYRATRWAAANSWIQCNACHRFMERRQGLWRRWRVAQIGAWRVEDVERLAQPTWKGDINEVIENLRRGVSQLERVA